MYSMAKQSPREPRSKPGGRFEQHELGRVCKGTDQWEWRGQRHSTFAPNPDVEIRGGGWARALIHHSAWSGQGSHEPGTSPCTVAASLPWAAEGLQAEP